MGDWSDNDSDNEYKPSTTREFKNDEFKYDEMGNEKTPTTSFEEAARKNDISALLQMISDGKQVNYRGGHHFSNDSALYIAAKRGFTEVMRILLDKGGGEITDSSSKGSSPLFGASYKGNVAACLLLLERGHSVDLGTEWGTTPLLAATDNNQIEVVRLLIEKGADVNLCADECVISPIHSAVLENNTDIVRLLLDAGCYLDETYTVPYLLAIERRDGISCEESKKMILAELEDRKVRQEFDKFINHHIEYQVYKDDIYSVGNYWVVAQALRNKYFFDEIFFYVHCYVALNYTSSRNCSNLIYTARSTNDACTIMTVLTNRLKLYLKPI